MHPFFSRRPDYFERETTSFAALPDHLKTADINASWNAIRQPGPVRTSFLEGPSFDLAGNLWCVDVVNGNIYSVSPAGEFRVTASYEGWPNGLKIHPDGRIFIADNKLGILVMDPLTYEVEPYFKDIARPAFLGVNDLVFTQNGDLYFTDQGSSGLHDSCGRMFRWHSNGRLDCLLDNIPSPNGLVFDPIERTLLIAVTRANAIWSVGFKPDGSVLKAGLFVQLSGGVGPDGLAVDELGCLYVAHPGLGSVWVFDADGELLQRIRTPQGRHPTNLAFGGKDNKTLFITESSSATICQIELDVAGQKMASHRDIRDGKVA